MGEVVSMDGAYCFTQCPDNQVEYYNGEYIQCRCNSDHKPKTIDKQEVCVPKNAKKFAKKQQLILEQAKAL